MASKLSPQHEDKHNHVRTRKFVKHGNFLVFGLQLEKEERYQDSGWVQWVKWCPYIGQQMHCWQSVAAGPFWPCFAWKHSSLFIRVLPYESEVNLTNFYLSWENGEVLWGQMFWTFIHTKKDEKSKKIGTCIRIHTCVYANTWWWGQICPPPSRIGLTMENNENYQKRRMKQRRIK